MILPHLYAGGTVTFLHPYTPESWADHIEADQSTFTYAPTPFIPAFAGQMRRRPKALRCVESVIHSGSLVPGHRCRSWSTSIGERYIEVWGMTEGVAPFSATTRDDWRAGGSGVSGPRTCTRRRGGCFGPQGFRTGDLGRLDPAGYVYVTGRVKDLIISGGMNVYPAEAEAAPAAMPGVAECVVLGLPDERWGEAVTAVIVPAPGAALTEDGVIAHVQTKIASYKRPQRVHFAAALPRNASLKVRKDELRAELGWRGQDGTGRVLDGTGGQG